MVLEYIFGSTHNKYEKYLSNYFFLIINNEKTIHLKISMCENYCLIENLGFINSSHH